MDSALGMGYGTTLTPVLLMMGFSPMEIVPAVLVSELATGLLAGLCHHKEGNVNFRPYNKSIFHLQKLRHPFTYFRGVYRSLPMDLKMSLLLGLCSLFGSAGAVFVALSIPKFWLKMYIGIVVLAMGLIILACLNKTFKFAVYKIAGLGLLASFNKGISGGGYGPLITAGQILSGIQGRNAVGITSLSESITCLVGVSGYFMSWIAGSQNAGVSFRLAPIIAGGAVLSVPLAAKSVKLLPPRVLKLAIAFLTIVLGILTIYQTMKKG